MATRKKIKVKVTKVVPVKTAPFPLFDAHCSEAKDGKHEPDSHTISARSDEEMVVDICCKLCGQSGSVTIKPEDILW